MKLVATMVATAVLMLAGLVGLLGGASTAAAAPARTPAVDEPAPGVALELRLTEMSPRVVTADGPGTLTVAGTLTNTGAEPVEQLVARVQRGDPLTTEGAIRDALEGNAPADAVTPQFDPLADRLEPGASITVRLTVPLTGAPETGLALSRTGVHELLVNVNGAPEGGQRARVAAVRVLVPVLSLPRGGSDTSGATSPAEPVGTQFSMLYPISDRPHRLSTVPGEPIQLDDDSLAMSFAPGGRLDGLVTAVAQVAPPNSPVRVATCLAIDPDLVETAAAMRGGYEVRARDGSRTPGTGAEAAGRWLDQLATVARGGCVIALPFADADLVALTRGGLADVAAAAVTDGREVLAEQLRDTAVAPPVTWPADGAVDDATLATIASTGDRALLLSADAVSRGRARATAGVVTLAGTDGQFAALTDPLLTLAATASTGSSASGAVVGGAAATTSPTGSDSPLGTQDTIGALAYRVQTATAGTDADGPLLLAPPRVWTAQGDGARALLGAVARLMDQGALVPRGVVDVLRSGPGPDAPERSADYPNAAGGQEVSGTVVDSIHRDRDGLADLLSAATDPDPGGVGVGPEEAFTPVRRGLVRPVSAALRGAPDAADTEAAQGSGRIGELRGRVGVLEPPIPYSLGTSDAPLPLTVVNGLPVTVRVRVEVAPTSGLRVAPIADQSIPPLGRRQLSVNAKVTRSGQFTVEARVLTPGGGQLGAASRIRVVSTVYGTITVWLTATAGVVLVALVARRVIRRRRGDPDSRPGPDLPQDPPGPPNRPLRGGDTDRLPELPRDPRGRQGPADVAATDPFLPRPGPGPGPPPGPRRTPTPGR